MTNNKFMLIVAAITFIAMAAGFAIGNAPRQDAILPEPIATPAIFIEAGGDGFVRVFVSNGEPGSRLFPMERMSTVDFFNAAGITPSVCHEVYTCEELCPD